MSPTDFPFHTWTAWAIEDFLSDRQGHPHLVFMGSSLMLVPLAGVEADYASKSIDASHHHRSVFFEDNFKKRSGLSARTFNFALPGEMPSDAFLITKFLLKDEKRPDVIVYGVGPRDFMDSTLPCPSATDPYQYLSRFGDVTDHGALLANTWEQRLNFELEHSIYPYGHKMDLQTQCQRKLLAWLDRCAPATGKPFTVHDRRSLFPQYKVFEITENECFFRPSKPEDRAFSDANLLEYRKRYKDLNRTTYDGQMSFLSEILATAKERGTHVVLVSMPITELNRSLLKDSTWTMYCNDLKTLAAKNDASFVDLNNRKDFGMGDFMDTVHLHAHGGAKMLKIIAEEISHDKKAISAIEDGQSKQAIAGLKAQPL